MANSRWRYDSEEIVDTWSCTGLVSDQETKVWRWWDTAHWSYDNIMSFGEGWSFAAPQCLHRFRKCHNCDHDQMTWLKVFWAAYCKAAKSSSSKYKTWHFLFPPAGAVILSHNFFVAVIRPGKLSYMFSLESIGPCMSEIQNLVFSWRVIKLWGHATVTRCDGKSMFELVFISILLRWHSQKLKLIWWKPWDKYFKVKMWNMAKMATKVKMADFLFGLANVSKRLICLLWKDRCPHSFLYMSANRGAGSAL